MIGQNQVLFILIVSDLVHYHIPINDLLDFNPKYYLKSLKYFPVHHHINQWCQPEKGVYSVI